MAGTMEEFIRERIDKTRKKVLAEVLESLTPEQRLEGLSVEERLKGLSAEEIRAALQSLENRGIPEVKPGL